MIALKRILIHGIILVKVKGDYIFKTQPIFLVHTNQFCIQRFGCRTCGKTNHSLLAGCIFFVNQFGYFTGNEF